MNYCWVPMWRHPLSRGAVETFRTQGCDLQVIGGRGGNNRAGRCCFWVSFFSPHFIQLSVDWTMTVLRGTLILRKGAIGLQDAGRRGLKGVLPLLHIPI